MSCHAPSLFALKFYFLRVHRFAREQAQGRFDGPDALPPRPTPALKVQTPKPSTSNTEIPKRPPASSNCCPQSFKTINPEYPTPYTTGHMYFPEIASIRRFGPRAAVALTRNPNSNPQSLNVAAIRRFGPRAAVASESCALGTTSS